jgi:DNA-binding transcriptional regulator YdaS (Cro superfamily)
MNKDEKKMARTLAVMHTLRQIETGKVKLPAKERAQAKGILRRMLEKKVTE